MKHHWQIRRQLTPYPDGQQRWDRAYQHLLRWTSRESPTTNPASAIPNPTPEVDHANSHLCPCVDAAPDTRPDD